MDEKELLKAYGAAYDLLNSKNIYEVRNLARAFGVSKPTSPRKPDLILRLIRLAAGIDEPELLSRRGARVKADKASDKSVEEVRAAIAACKAAAPYPALGEKEGVPFHDAGKEFGYGDKCAAGLLEITPSGFGRLCSPRAGAEPVVPERMIRSYGLREGDLLNGYLLEEKGRPAEIARIISINGYPPVTGTRRKFEDFAAAFPNERLQMGAGGCALLRAADLLCPLGKGQRALIFAPSGTGKTTFLREAARSFAASSDARLLFVLVDQRPEESAELHEAVPGAAVMAAPFDAPPARRVQVARLALERAKRLAENGKDAVILLDSVVALLRAYEEEGAGEALLRTKQYFGAARRLEGSGSLTILATAEEGGEGSEAFVSAANAVFRLDAGIAAAGVIPAIDFARSFARRGDALLAEEELEKARQLRSVAQEEGVQGILAALKHDTTQEG